MWMAEPVNIEVARNATTPVGFQFWDGAADAPLDITGFAMTCKVASADGQTFIAIHDVDITDYVNGNFDVVFDGRNYGAVPGQKELATASFQIIADDGEDPVTAMRGLIYIVPGI